MTTGNADTPPASASLEPFSLRPSTSFPHETREARAIAASDAAIHIRGLRKVYGEIKAVRGIDLDVQRGEIFGLIGPDGAGKTSVFQILGGVMRATSGEAIML